MEKLLLFSCMLILSGYSAYSQEFYSRLSVSESIGRLTTDALINLEKEGFENGILVSENLNMPDKGARIKKKTERNGFFVVFNERGDTQFVGNYRKGQLNGKWMSWFNNRNACDSGLLINNLPDGIWKGWYANGNPRYILQFNARKLNALKNELVNQPKIKYFNLANRRPDEASMHYDALLLFGHETPEVKTILLSKKVNHPVYSLETVKKIVAENVEVNNGSYYKAPFSEGLLHGQFTSFHPNGSVKESGLYLNGLREGMWEEYTLQKEKAVGTYRHGYRNGEWRYYSKEGKLLYWKRFDVKGSETEKYSFAGN